jgi:hypothetical protein
MIPNGEDSIDFLLCLDNGQSETDPLLRIPIPDNPQEFVVGQFPNWRQSTKSQVSPQEIRRRQGRPSCDESHGRAHAWCYKTLVVSYLSTLTVVQKGVVAQGTRFF